MPPKRPRTDTVDSIDDALKYRSQLLSAISVNIARIQDILLTEQQIRDLNDTINKQFKEKWRWEKRLLQLNGPNYTKTSTSNINSYKDNSFVVNRHRYFGRARELPDVVKLLEEAAIERNNSELRKDMKRNIIKFNDQKNWPDQIYIYKKNQALEFIDAIKSNNYSNVTNHRNENFNFKHINFIPQKLSSNITKQDLKQKLLKHKKDLLKERILNKKKL
jgi:pre-mRNA-splicing factor ISY1